jgi:phenylpropionate dioxygenase-like ring-hydroxylating dioxygenase large terminal subunit
MFSFHLCSLIIFQNIVSYYSISIKHNFFTNWNCIGIVSNIDFSKPYKINIGELPLVLWKNPKNNQYTTTINICHHMGSTLDTGKITSNGCLKCPYHGLEISHSDGFGETVEHEGKLFWAYNPIKINPYSIPFFTNNDYAKSYLEVDMDCSLVDSAFNTMDLRHPEFVHNKLFGFGSIIPPTNIKHFIYEKSKGIGLAFKYSSNRIMQKFNDNVQDTDNFHMYNYPTFSWSKVSFGNKNLLISVNLLPLSEKKTRWYITICHNYYKTELGKSFMKLLAMNILTQDFHQLKTQYPENELKKAILFTHIFKDEEPILELRKLFQEYKYPDINDCVEIYNDYKENRQK